MNVIAATNWINRANEPNELESIKWTTIHKSAIGNLVNIHAVSECMCVPAISFHVFFVCCADGIILIELTSVKLWQPKSQNSVAASIKGYDIEKRPTLHAWK